MVFGLLDQLEYKIVRRRVAMHIFTEQLKIATITVNYTRQITEMKSTKRKQSIYVRCATVIQFTRLP